jgi:hypothetical protein
MNERIKELLARPGLERLNDWVSIGPVQRAALEEFAELIAVDALRAKLTTETLTWHPADEPPDADLLVLLGFRGDGWEAGYWDSEHWRNDENAVVTEVTHWAHPKGPL